MNADSFIEFAREFQAKCIVAFGKAAGGKDRDDRIWKVVKINNKLEELGLPYKIECNNVDKLFWFTKIQATMYTDTTM